MDIRVISNMVTPEYNNFKKNVYSQNGEDGLIEYFTRKIGLLKETGYFVEFGAWDGRHFSNCANLADAGWAGCFIEGDVDRFTDLDKSYVQNENILKVNKFVQVAGRNSLDQILVDANAPRDLDILSIDVDGNDYLIWSGLLLHRPRMVIVEYNPTIPSDVIAIQNDEFGESFGSSLTAFWELAQIKGYDLVAVTDTNAFFILDELCSVKEIKTYTPWEIKDKKYETYIFHGYNGRVVAEGNKRLVWHEIAFNDEDFQVLPKRLQKFPSGQSDEYYENLSSFISSR